MLFAKTSYESETVCNKEKTENLLIYTALGEIALINEKVFIDAIKAIKKEPANGNHSKLRHELSVKEFEDLSKRIDHVLKGLECVQTDDRPIA